MGVSELLGSQEVSSELRVSSETLRLEDRGCRLARGSQIHPPPPTHTAETHQALEGTFDEGLRDNSSSGEEIRAQARFLRHPKELKSASGSKVTSLRRGVFKTCQGS